MHWTFEARKYLVEAQWPTTKKDLIDYLTNCTEAPEQLIKTLEELDLDEEVLFYNIDEMWDGMPKLSDYYFDDEAED